MHELKKSQLHKEMKTNKLKWFGLSVATALLIGGCGNQEPASPSGSAETPESQSREGLSGMMNEAESAAGKMAESGEAAAEAMADTVEVYPLKVCVVSGEELGSMGDPVVIEHEGTTVKFCCKNCVPDFKEDPSKYLSKLTEAQPK